MEELGLAKPSAISSTLEVLNFFPSFWYLNSPFYRATHKLKKTSENVSEMEVETTVTEQDLYTKLKKLQRQLDFIAIQEDYVKDEQKNLKRELLLAQEEVKRIQSVPLMVGQFVEMIDAHHGNTI